MNKFIIGFILFASNSIACTVDNTPMAENIETANHIFIGYVVEKHFIASENNIIKNYNHRKYQHGEQGSILIGSVPYLYRAIPVKIFKTSGPIPAAIWGGYCKGALVEGSKKYIIMTYKNTENAGYDSKSWSAEDPYFKELETILYTKYKKIIN
jgi:hypothetical protein